MKSAIAVLLVLSTGLGAYVANAALALSGTSYSQSFDGIGGGLPTGWSVSTGATVSGNGTAATLNTAATSWGTATGQFRNVASADGLTAGALSATQDAATDRTLGIRQSGTFGDPGAAFVLQIQDTVGLENFNLSLSLQMLSVQPRSTTWTIDYRVGDSGDFTALDTYADPGAFGATTKNFSYESSDLVNWADQSSSIWFRVVALSASSGSGNRDTFGIDDFTLSFSEIAPVPEPAGWGLISAVGLLGICGQHAWRLRRRAVVPTKT